jgi:gliding motility-associated protein GldC
MRRTSEIVFQVELDEKNIPEKIRWKATDQENNQLHECKSIMLSIWDAQEKNTLRIDLWTKDMRIDEMDQQFFQTLITMAETYQRATQNNFVLGEMKKFCNELAQKINAEEERKRGN